MGVNSTSRPQPGGGRVVDSLAAFVRTHYLDRRVEQQAVFHQALAETLELIRAQLDHRKTAAGFLDPVIAPPSTSAWATVEAVASLGNTLHPNDALGLADAMPGFGEYLGPAIYDMMHATSLMLASSWDAGAATHLYPALLHLKDIARRAEEAYDGAQNFRAVVRWHATRLSGHIERVDRLGNEVGLEIPQPPIRQMKGWLLSHLASHIHAYIDQAFVRQMAFNWRVVKMLRSIESGGLDAPDDAPELESAADIVAPGYQVTSRVPLLGKLITRLRRASLAALQFSLLDPALARQGCLNRESARQLVALRSQMAEQRRREESQIAAAQASLLDALSQLGASEDTPTGQSDAAARARRARQMLLAFITGLMTDRIQHALRL
jgi:hypothetical protein